MPSSRGHHGPASNPTSHPQPVAQTVTEAVDAVFTRFDTNDDASITLAELTAILDPNGTHTTWASQLDTLFAAADTDADGGLSTAEVTAQVAARDTNADGTLDRSDFLSGSTDTRSPTLIDALLHAGRGHGGPGGPGTDVGGRTIAAVVEGLVTRFDADANGALTLTELLAVLDPAGTRTQLAATVTSLYGTVDTDGDASISSAELTTAVTALDIDASGTLDRADHVHGTHDAGTVDLIGVLMHLPDLPGHAG